MKFDWRHIVNVRGVIPTIAAIVLCTTGISPSHAIPVFARQTGQNCVACHVGGQFPELTPYGRLFKLTGYTMGSRTLPLAAMAVVDFTKVRNANDSTGMKDSAVFVKDNQAVADFGSIFLAGKITDNLGIMAQATYAHYDHDQTGNGDWVGHMNPDNSELRYADRFISPGSDLIVGAFANDNPGMQDVWNSTPVWGYPYIGPNGHFVLGSAAPVLAGRLAQQSIGAGIYAFWDKSLYGEFSMYKTPNGPFGFLHSGDNSNLTRIKDGAPYWRFAYMKELGPHNLMVGTSGLIANIYEGGDFTAPSDRFEDLGLDAQYQYILDPHAVTAQVKYIHEDTKWGVPPGSNATDTLSQFQLKGTYVYRAKYGADLSYNQVTGRNDAGWYGTGGPVDVTGNVSGSPDASYWIPEVFWIPTQYVRVGAQYWHYTKFNGASSNYDGFGRNASDNDTLFFYIWGAY
jgi:hypothetical protein